MCSADSCDCPAGYTCKLGECALGSTGTELTAGECLDTYYTTKPINPATCPLKCTDLITRSCASTLNACFWDDLCLEGLDCSELGVEGWLCSDNCNCPEGYGCIYSDTDAL